MDKDLLAESLVAAVSAIVRGDGEERDIALQEVFIAVYGLQIYRAADCRTQGERRALAALWGCKTTRVGRMARIAEYGLAGEVSPDLPLGLLAACCDAADETGQPARLWFEAALGDRSARSILLVNKPDPNPDGVWSRSDVLRAAGLKLPREDDIEAAEDLGPARREFISTPDGYRPALILEEMPEDVITEARYSRVRAWR